MNLFFFETVSALVVLGFVVAVSYWLVCRPLAARLILCRNRHLPAPKGVTFTPFLPDLRYQTWLIFMVLYLAIMLIITGYRLDYDLFVATIQEALVGEGDAWQAAGVGAVIGFLLLAVPGLVTAVWQLIRTPGRVDWIHPPEDVARTSGSTPHKSPNLRSIK